MESQKVAAGHLRRNAYLYVRQSTLRQVLENTESTKRQYALRQRAVALGWTSDQVIVIDCDQGTRDPSRPTGRVSSAWSLRSPWDEWGSCSALRFPGWRATPLTGTGCWSCAQ